MTWAWGQNVPPSTKAVLLALADHADDDGICWPGIKGVAEKCRLSKRTVRYHLGILRHAGLLNSEADYRQDGSQTANIYRLPVNILTAGMSTITPLGDNHDIPGGQPLHPLNPHLIPNEPSKGRVNRGAAKASPFLKVFTTGWDGRHFPPMSAPQLNEVRQAITEWEARWGKEPSADVATYVLAQAEDHAARNWSYARVVLQRCAEVGTIPERKESPNGAYRQQPGGNTTQAAGGPVPGRAGAIYTSIPSGSKYPSRREQGPE